MRCTIILACIILLGFCAFSQNTRRPLTVSLYTAVPNSDNFYFKVKTEFEKAHRDIELIIFRNPDYYNETSGIIADTTDVLEIDCILLQDFIDNGLIQPIPSSFTWNRSDLLPAGKVVDQNTMTYGIPHWLCGNFAFYRRGDSALQNAKTLKDFETALGAHPKMEGGLLVDMYGRLTLGELYADGVLDEYKQTNAIVTNSDPNNINLLVQENLNRLTQLKYSNWGRTDPYHRKNGFYPKQFAKRHGRVLVGYSESLYYVLDELSNACAVEEKCLTADSIDIMSWPLSDKGNTSLGWVDALALKKNLSASKTKDALTFIGFLTSKEGYDLALKPSEGEAPRYLLPAFKSFYTDSALLSVAPLYEKLYPLAVQLTPVTGKNLCANLRAIGKKLTTSLKP